MGACGGDSGTASPDFPDTLASSFEFRWADGRVYGVVFAAAVEDRHTGYALTAAEVASDARAGADATATASTRGCD